MPPAADLLDLPRLEELRRDLPARILATLCGQCLADMEPRLARLSTAVAAGEARAAEREAHALAGMAGSYGLGAIERHSRAILDGARAGDMQAARAVARELDDIFAHSRVALMDWLSA